MNLLNKNTGPYIIAMVLLLCGTAIVIVSMFLHIEIPAVYINSVILILGSIISFVYGHNHNNNSGTK